ncbi:MAG: diadenylate cyclase CdaA [bacterium]|nr:diadenylate cyclase CdaA [candidate division KSB1 bacterium]MDH7560547.1 diadenylate cyclase CdaA [bacterium]
MVLFRIGFIPVTLFDVLDIAVISYLLYRVYFFIRGTRAAQMTVGLVVILVLSVVAPLFNLGALSWLFQNLKTIWLVAFVVVFQPELRRLLIYIGQTRLARYFVSVAGTRTVEEVIKASLELSKRGYGGLIVLVKETGLRPVVETGVRLQAEVSVPLIVSIFNPRSPLHDGAIVIQNELIEAARCILPLSDNPQLDQTLGTRHRAAVGLSEESDAVVIVISEETGTISVAYKGVLKRGMDEQAMRRELEQDLRVTPS